MVKNKKNKILLIEDESNIRKTLKMNLEEEGFIVYDYESAEDYINKNPNFIENINIDLAIIDVMLPGKIDGITLTRKIRSRWDIPIIILTARNRIEQKLDAFDSGADDYITKPFELEELIARVKIKFRKRVTNKIKIGNFIVDFIYQEIYNLETNEKIHLTNKENGILYLLYQNKGKPVSRDQILDELWYGEYPTNRTIDNFILRLRKIFEKDTANPEYIITKHGKGYLLSDKVEEIQE